MRIIRQIIIIAQTIPKTEIKTKSKHCQHYQIQKVKFILLINLTRRLRLYRKFGLDQRFEVEA